MQKKKKAHGGGNSKISNKVRNSNTDFSFHLDSISGPATVWPGAGHCRSVTLVFIYNMNWVRRDAVSQRFSSTSVNSLGFGTGRLSLWGRAGQSKAGLEARSPAHDLLLASRGGWPGYSRSTRLLLKHSMLFCPAAGFCGLTGCPGGLEHMQVC